MDFNQLKPLISRYGENQTIVPEWVEGQLFYVVSDELLKKLIDEVNASRLLREKLAKEIEADRGILVLKADEQVPLIRPALARHYAYIIRGIK